MQVKSYPPSMEGTLKTDSSYSTQEHLPTNTSKKRVNKSNVKIINYNTKINKVINKENKTEIDKCNELETLFRSIRVTSGYQLACPCCPFYATAKNRVLSHIRTKHLNLKFSCHFTGCKFTCVRGDQLSKHKKKEHAHQYKLLWSSAISINIKHIILDVSKSNKEKKIALSQMKETVIVKSESPVQCPICPLGSIISKTFLFSHLADHLSVEKRTPGCSPYMYDFTISKVDENLKTATPTIPAEINYSIIEEDQGIDEKHEPTQDEKHQVSVSQQDMKTTGDYINKMSLAFLM